MRKTLEESIAKIFYQKGLYMIQAALDDMGNTEMIKKKWRVAKSSFSGCDMEEYRKWKKRCHLNPEC